MASIQIRGKKVTNEVETQEETQLIVSEREQGQRALPTVYESGNVMQMAEMLLNSKMLPSSLRQPEQVAAIILRGRELGIGPMEALTSLHVIKGRVVSSTQLMLALIYRSGFLEDIQIVRDDPVSVTMKRQGMTPHTVTFGSEDMERAKLQHKDNYKKWPTVMFVWRSVAICARVVFPDVIGAVYSPDELGVEIRSDNVDYLNGEYVEEKGTKLFTPPGSESWEEKARALAEKGKSASEIARELKKPLPKVKQAIGD